MNTCSICKHMERVEIESALVRGSSLRDIARQFQTSKDAVSRHQECIADVLAGARKARDLKSARDLDEQLSRALAVAEKLLDACEAELIDPEDHNRYTLAPRASEVEIVYEMPVKGSEVIRAKATLAALLRKVESSRNMKGVKFESVFIRRADPRELMLKVVDRLERLLARHKGIDPPQPRSEIDLVAIKIEEMRELGCEVTREEAERLIEEETERFIRLARKTGQNITASDLIN